MTQRKPLAFATPVGIKVPSVDELTPTDDLELGAAATIRNPSGVDMLALAAQTPGIQSAGPRGGVPFQDLPRGPREMFRRSGLWTVGTHLSGDVVNPERFSAYYRTRILGTYSGSTGTAPAVNDTVTGSTGGWTARVVSVNLGGSSFQLSQFSGTAAGAGAEVLTGPAGTWTGVSVSTFVGSITDYADPSGEKAPFHDNGTTSSGYCNCLGAPQDMAFAPVPNRIPTTPETFNEGFEPAKGEFADGAQIDITYAGVWLNTTPDPITFYTMLNIGQSMFAAADQGSNDDNRLTFASTHFPVSAVEVPFRVTITLTASSKADRTEGIIALMRFESEAHSFIAGLQRGSDRLDAPSFPGFEFFDGDDSVNLRTKRNVSVWFAVGTDIAAPVTRGEATSGEAYFAVHTVRAEIRGAV